MQPVRGTHLSVVTSSQYYTDHRHPNIFPGNPQQETQGNYHRDS